MNNSIASLSLKRRGGGASSSGVSFPTLGASLTNQYCQIASIYNNNAIVGLYGGVGTYYSTDYGVTYAQSTGISGTIGTSVILGVSLYGLRAIAHTATLVFYSSNAGQSWTLVPNLPGVSGSRNYQGCAIYDNYAIISDTGARIYVSNNYGLNWSTITIASRSFRQPAISFNSANNQYIAVCSTSNDTMYYCTNFTGDASNIFTRCATGLLQAVGVSLVGLKGAAGSFFSYRGFWYTVDGGVNWTKSASFPTTGSYALGLSENGVGIANGTNASSYFVTKNYGVTWTQSTLTGIDVCTIQNNNAIAFRSNNPSRAFYGVIPL
jgi:hypothetical protein